MLISVLVPVYNVEKYIDECINSILKQEYEDFELILVDDGSTDKSGEICNQYACRDTRIKVIHKDNRGLVSARRIGIREASGDYCIFCDSDDFLEKNALKEISTVLNSKKPDILIYNSYVYEGNTKKGYKKPPFKEGFINDKELLLRTLFTTYTINSLWMKAVKTELFDKERDYTHFYKCNYGEDLLQSLPLFIKAQSVFYDPICLYNYRYESGMMRHYSANYYWSYRMVNQEARILLAEEILANPVLEEYVDYHLLIAAYGGVTQYKYKDRYNATEFREIADDEFFISTYTKVKKYKNVKLGRKQKVILFLLKHKLYRIIKILLKIR